MIFEMEENMGRRAKKSPETGDIVLRSGKSRPAMTPEEREQEIITLAYDRAEQQIREGTASSQVLVHFLKRGTIEREYELEKLKKENALLAAKTSAIESAQRSEELFSQAIEAMKKYRGINDHE